LGGVAGLLTLTDSARRLESPTITRNDCRSVLNFPFLSMSISEKFSGWSALVCAGCGACTRLLFPAVLTPLPMFERDAPVGGVGTREEGDAGVPLRFGFSSMFEADDGGVLSTDWPTLAVIQVEHKQGIKI
jgi:hypothetical protein